MKLGDISQSLSTVNFSKFSKFYKYKSESIQWISQWKNTAYKGSIPGTCSKLSQEFWRILKIAKR